MRLMTWLNDSNTKLHAGKRIRHQALSLVKPGQGYGTWSQGNTQGMEIFTKSFGKEAQASDTRIATLAIRVLT
ncbi:hypothetical protein Tco_1386530 [Tanacetum coccineum]